MKNFNQNKEIVNSQDQLKNNKFEELLKNMEDLKETEEGKLKGGFVVFNVEQENDSDSNGDITNVGYCPSNSGNCVKGCGKSSK